MTTATVSEHARPPFWRDERVLAVIAQIIFLIVVIVVAAYMYSNMYHELSRRGLKPGFDFLKLEAGFPIGETPIPYTPGDTYARAFLVGVVNTIKVSVIGIILATILGIVIGVARLSTNWLLRAIATVYIEIIRNTPLLVQLFFWFTAVMLKFPRIKQAIRLPGPIYLSNRGIAMVWFKPTESFSLWLIFLLAGLVVATLVFRYRSHYQDRTGNPGYPWIFGSATWLLFALVGWFLVPGAPITVDKPVLAGLNFKGGARLTPEFSALLVGLVVYTAAFIAEVVRAGILAVDKGQREAAKALGLTDFQMMRYIVFPQAMRVIIPPLTSQYLNLTKNSSLAVAIGYPDLFNVAGTIFNQTGKSIEVITLIMGSYLSMSLLTSLFMNWYNRRVRLVER
ncbi:MAG: ABC transporter permease subunit [Chloroflexi bacterium]|nr:ABC transporter permease subunit [Chloroflexota bacterium]